MWIEIQFAAFILLTIHLRAPIGQILHFYFLKSGFCFRFVVVVLVEKSQRVQNFLNLED